MSNLKFATLLLNQTRELLQLAQRDDWNAFEALQQTRMERMAEFDRLEVGAEEVDGLRAVLVEMRALNQQLVGLADTRREQLLQEKRALNKGRQMQNAYKG